MIDPHTLSQESPENGVIYKKYIEKIVLTTQFRPDFTRFSRIVNFSDNENKVPKNSYQLLAIGTSFLVEAVVRLT